MPTNFSGSCTQTQKINLKYLYIYYLLVILRDMCDQHCKEKTYLMEFNDSKIHATKRRWKSIKYETQLK